MPNDPTPAQKALTKPDILDQIFRDLGDTNHTLQAKVEASRIDEELAALVLAPTLTTDSGPIQTVPITVSLEPPPAVYAGPRRRSAPIPATAHVAGVFVPHLSIPRSELVFAWAASVVGAGVLGFVGALFVLGVLP